MKRMFSTVLFSVVIMFSISLARDTLNGPKRALLPQSEFITRTLCNISKWSFWVYRDGKSGNNPNGDPGGHFPVPGAHAIFTDGIVWGGYVDDGGQNPRVGGVTYRTGTVPGWIQQNGTPVDPNDPRAVVYRIRHDWKNYQYNLEEFRNDAAQLYLIDPQSVTNDQLQSVYDQYESDWNNWPVDLGAPFYDVNGNGVYDGIGIVIDLNGDGIISLGEREEPGYALADQVLWYVVNDFDQMRTTSLYGSDPIGLEIQTTLWAYDTPGVHLGSTMFKKTKIINKSGSQIYDMYICQWSDPDIGTYTNDLCGVDTVLQTAYAYNGNSIDGDLNALNLAPTAAGYVLLQGPIVPSAGDSAVFNNHIIYDHKNLPITSFGYFSAGSSIHDPDLGEYNGTLQFYNLLRGYLPDPDIENPQPYITGSGPLTGQPTKFPLSGDAFLRTGDVDGMGDNLYPGDRRMLFSTGPITMQSGDTQEIVVALVGGTGSHYLNSVAQLKLNSSYIREGYRQIFRFEPVPDIGLSTSTFELFAVFSWDDLSSVYPVKDYDLLGYKLFQIDINDNLKIEIASFDKADGITSVTDTLKGIPTVVYSGAENGLQTTFQTEKDVLTNRDFFYGRNYHFGIKAYVYNQDAKPGQKVLSNELYLLSVLFLPEYFESEFLAEHITGNGDGSVVVRLSDVTNLNGHTYHLTFSRLGESDTLISTLTDLTDDQVITISEKLLFNVDDQGFQIDISDDFGAIGWDYTGTRWISGNDWGGSQFYGSLDVGTKAFFGSTLGRKDIKNVSLEFQGADDVSSNGFISRGALYRRDQEYSHYGSGDLPLAAYDISDENNPRRLNICFVESDGEDGAVANGVWDMGWTGSEFPGDRGAREYLLVMASDYDEGANYNDDNFGLTADVMYFLWPRRRTSHPYLEAPFTFIVYGGQGLDAGDVFKFNTNMLNDLTTISSPDKMPTSFYLDQNYPNPFNPSTTISFAIAEPVHVKITIYNLLGQRVKILADKMMYPGNYIEAWDGKDQFYRPVSSGTYFFMLRAGEFTDIKKMVLIR